MIPHLLKLNNQQKSIFLLVCVYAVGLIGFLIPEFRSFFAALTPLNLMFSGFILWVSAPNLSAVRVLYFMAIAIAGFMVEWVGVHTGLIFGDYQYGANLGPHWSMVPPLIGLNWWMLVVGSGAIAVHYKLHPLLQSMLAASLMTALDFLIEPFAIRYDLWTWNHDAIPAQNYFAWWLIAFAMHLPAFFYQWHEKHNTAVALFGIQIVFFGFLNLWPW